MDAHHVYIDGSLWRVGRLKHLVQAAEECGARGDSDISLNATCRWEVVTETCDTKLMRQNAATCLRLCPDLPLQPHRPGRTSAAAAKVRDFLPEGQTHVREAGVHVCLLTSA